MSHEDFLALITPAVENVNAIGGNASFEEKELILKNFIMFTWDDAGFAAPTSKRLVMKEVNIYPGENEPSKLEARVVCECRVEEDMLNERGLLHEGCSAYLIDVCSTFPLSVLSQATGGPKSAGVSHSLQFLFHESAPVGTLIKIVSSSVALGGRSMTARSEIWDADRNRLLVSAIHMKMQASKAKL